MAAARIALIVLALAVTLPGETDAAFPGANGSIAFQSDIGSVHPGHFDIYVMNADGSVQTRLTTSSGRDPSWSPDGTKIAFASNSGIYVMNADGSSQTRLTDRPAATDEFPVWSPDGSKIAFASFVCCPAGANYDIWVMNADGTNQTNVTNNPAQDIVPAWSPDGSKIAFITSRDGNSEIYTMNPDGTGATNVSNSPASVDQSPDWSPDGSRIAFASNRAAICCGPDVYVMNADGSGVTRLTNTRADFDAAWSPDGSKIVLTSFRDSGGFYEIYAINADGSGATRLTNSPRQEMFPDWQPLPLRDTTPPVLTVPPDITAEASDPVGATVTYSATATDGTDPNPAVVCIPPSGSTFPLGATTVSCTATDASGNSSSASFHVAVVDTTPPKLNVPTDITANAAVPAGTEVLFTAESTDVVDGIVSVVCVPPSGSMFPIGDTTVECAATDAAGNSSMGSFAVHVKGAAEQAADLLALVDSYDLDKLGTSLHDKLVTVQGFLADGKPREAEESLAAFINQVSAQRGKGLTEAQADELAAAAQQIIDVIDA